MALIGDPELLFLDEPTTGFDPSARRQAWDVIAGLRDLGKTVFLTTHYMDEAQRLADRVTIIAAGEIVARGTPEDLGEREAPAATIRYRAGGEEVSCRRRPRSQTLHELTGEALARGEELEGLEVTRPTLEDVYLELTEPRRPSRDGTAGGGGMSGLALVGHQFRYDQKAFWRNPASVFFTVMFPVVVFLILSVVFDGSTVERRRRDRGDHLLRAGDHGALGDLGDDADAGDDPGDRPRRRPPQARPRHPAAGLGLHRRPDRQLDRGHGADAGAAGGDRRPPLLGPVPVGAAAGDAGGAGDRRRRFCCLGIALTAAIPSQDAAAAIVNALLLPLYFLSGIFIPEDELPNGVIDFANHFPVRPFFEAFFQAYVPGDRPRDRLAQAAGGRDLGRRRPAAGDPLLPLDPALRLSGRAFVGSAV